MEKHCCTHEGRSAHHSDEFKVNLVKRLNRIEGQVRGIQAMVQGDIYCDDVLTQISAVRSALSSVANMLFEAHTKSCITEQIQSGNKEVVDELLQTIRRMMK
jgi:CsoR family transcriptional regulator, copper-sensing transcriptional repressor